jgi:hypothetical protein
MARGVASGGGIVGVIFGVALRVDSGRLRASLRESGLFGRWPRGVAQPG